MNRDPFDLELHRLLWGGFHFTRFELNLELLVQQSIHQLDLVGCLSQGEPAHHSFRLEGFPNSRMLDSYEPVQLSYCWLLLDQFIGFVFLLLLCRLCELIHIAWPAHSVTKLLQVHADRIRAQVRAVPSLNKATTDAFDRQRDPQILHNLIEPTVGDIRKTAAPLRKKMRKSLFFYSWLWLTHPLRGLVLG
jgi:hypothetical protein